LPNYLVLFFSTLSLLSLIAAGLILFYLVRTESNAPQFAKSILSLDQGPWLGPKPKVSVIVAARNEEKMIGDCIRSLLGQSYPNLEIIAVDDSSTDSTLQILEKISIDDKRLRPVCAGKKPEGWVGKTWPCWRGFEGSTGEILLFVDADSKFRSDLLDLCVRYIEQKKIDMFSLGPRVKINGLWARSVLPLITGAINLLYPMQKVNDSASKRAYVFGTFFLVKRSVYEKTGGHSSIRNEIVEDAALGTLVKTSGYRLRVERGIQFLETVWEDDFRSIYVGLERVFSTSVKGIGSLSLLNAVFLLLVMIYPLLFLAGFVLLRSANYVILLGVFASLGNAVIFLTLSAYELRAVTGRMGVDPILYPIGGLVFISAILSTTLKMRSNIGLEWKGQAYKITDRKTVSAS
jgi:chlorobactene glucosyltransferase